MNAAAMTKRLNKAAAGRGLNPRLKQPGKFYSFENEAGARVCCIVMGFGIHFVPIGDGARVAAWNLAKDAFPDYVRKPVGCAVDVMCGGTSQAERSISRMYELDEYAY